MNIKKLLENELLKKAALLLAEQQRQLKESPGDDLLFAQVVGMTQMAYEIVDNDYALKALYEYYCQKLDQSLPKPGQAVFYYDPLEDYTPRLAKVVESSDWPKWVRCECDNTTFDVTDRDIYLLLYW